MCVCVRVLCVVCVCVCVCVCMCVCVCKVYYHLLGTEQAEDVLCYEMPDHPDWLRYIYIHMHVHILIGPA